MITHSMPERRNIRTILDTVDPLKGKVFSSLTMSRIKLQKPPSNEEEKYGTV